MEEAKVQTDAYQQAYGKTRVNSQTRYLKRGLYLKLFRNWILYTLIFVLAALLLNYTLVPRIADSIADATSTWQYYNKSDYPLSACLSILNGSLLAQSASFAEHEELDALGAKIEGKAQQMREEGMSSSQIMADLEYAVELAPYTDMDEIPVENPILVSIGGEQPTWTSTSSLQHLAIQAQLGVDNVYSPWQILETEFGVEARDLSTYYFIRQFKIPLAVVLYMIGCALVVISGYKRALSYFDELTQAVGGMIADREKPVKLSRQLSITQNELNEIRLASLADERTAEAAERRKNELVAYLAHDIKTPLTSIMGYLMILDEAPDLPAEIRERYIKTVSDKALHLESLINEFFEITRYNLQAIPIERENIELSMLCEQVAEEFYPICEKRGLTISVNAPEESLAFVDPGKFARALENIVRNAVAYADSDSVIEIVLARSGDKAAQDAKETSGEDASEGASWKIDVVNQGKEISPAHLESIFEKFYREDGARSTNSGGSGLGLAIAKEIIAAHKGTIGAESENGRTVFSVVIPS